MVAACPCIADFCLKVFEQNGQWNLRKFPHSYCTCRFKVLENL